MNTFLWYYIYVCIVLYIIGWIRIIYKYIFRSPGMHEGVIPRESYILYYVTNRFRMQEMYNKIMRIIPNAFHHIPDRFKTQEM